MTTAAIHDDPTTHHAPPLARAMSPSEVMQVLIDLWRQRIGLDANEEIAIPINPEASVANVAEAAGLSNHRNWVEIAVQLQDLFQIQADRASWHALLNPPNERPLGPVCQFIAHHAVAPSIARSGESARDVRTDAFFTILSILDDSGIDTGGAVPGSPLQPFLDRAPQVFTNRITRLAPGRLPALRTINPAFRFAIVLLAMSTAVFVINLALRKYLLDVLGVFGIVLGFVCLFLSAIIPYRVRRFPGVRTFQDLAFVLTDPPPKASPPLAMPNARPLRWTSTLRTHHRAPVIRSAPDSVEE